VLSAIEITLHESYSKIYNWSSKSNCFSMFSSLSWMGMPFLPYKPVYTAVRTMYIICERGRYGFDWGAWSLNCMPRSSGLVKKSTNFLFADYEALPVAA